MIAVFWRALRQTLRGTLALLACSQVLATEHPAHLQERTNLVPQHEMALNALSPHLEVGDVVFIRVPFLLFRKVADANNSWTNHVGVIVDTSGAEPLVGESRVPLSGTTPLSRFVKRSENGRVAVLRREIPLSENEKAAVMRAAQRRSGRWYDLGFDIDSSREFCSKYVREVLLEAAGIEVGAVQNFSTLLAEQPRVDQGFWKWWFFGHIPWGRRTVTPASQLQSALLTGVFDGRVLPPSTH